MAACDPKTFNNVDKEVFTCLSGKLSGLGYSLQGTSGTINGPMGIVIDFRWDEGNSSLFIDVTSKNFLVPCSRIFAELDKAIASCR
jgi:hypothetical protein